MPYDQMAKKKTNFGDEWLTITTNIARTGIEREATSGMNRWGHIQKAT